MKYIVEQSGKITTAKNKSVEADEEKFSAGAGVSDIICRVNKDITIIIIIIIIIIIYNGEVKTDPSLVGLEPGIIFTARCTSA